MNHPNATLLLAVESEPYEVHLLPDDINRRVHGLLTNTVRLLGLVEIAFLMEGDTIVYVRANNNIAWYCKDRSQDIKELGMGQILEAHHSGTLPGELYQSETNPDGLREEDCDE